MTDSENSDFEIQLSPNLTPEKPTARLSDGSTNSVEITTMSKTKTKKHVAFSSSPVQEIFNKELGKMVPNVHEFVLPQSETTNEDANPHSDEDETP